ncbi:MAG: transaldolase [Actinomycetaceae bacterium]|nr:transaldolase [Actinomycetaceae bacterium]
MADKLGELSRVGVSIWLDDLSRDRIESGNLQKLIDEDHVVGVTTNPTIFQAAIGDGSAYQQQIAQLAKEGVGAEAAIAAMTTDDVRAACDVMMPIFKSSGGLDGRVSIEVDPRLADKTEETVQAAKELWERVDRPNVLIKIPATEAGLPAISQVIAAGIPVNVTLIFSVPQYRRVLNAYMDGLEQAAAAGLDLRQISSVASVFVSRVDTAIDSQLGEGDVADAIRGKTGVANAILVYEAFEEVMHSDRWVALESKGATRQRPLWASTGVKDTKLPPTLYVTELAVDGVVNTMPEATLRAVAAEGVIRGDVVHSNFGVSQRTFDGLAELGINIEEVAEQLLSEGVKKFEDAWEQLIVSVQKALDEAV